MTSLPSLHGLGRRLRILRRPSEPIRPTAPRPLRRDCHGRLQAALQELAGADAVVRSSGLRPWSSATFIGAQHDLVVHLHGPDASGRAEALASTLPEHEFKVRGHLVADLAVDGVEIGNGHGHASLQLSILTIEDW